MLVSRVAKCSQMLYLYFERASNYLPQRNSALAEWRRKRDELKAKRDRGIEYEPGPKGKELMKMKSSRLRKSFPTESKKPTSEIVVENDNSIAKSSSNCHPRRTLDQSYYFTLSEDEISTRDEDQVISSYSTDVLGRKDPYLLIVDQLWLWVIDTCMVDPSILL